MADDHAPFNRPRIIGGLLLLGVASVLVIVDAFSSEYQADWPTLALFLGTAGVLLGVEGIRRYLDGAG